ncbi:hypothetical protein AVEN_110961-1, partial [Araneus ventricosus]
RDLSDLESSCLQTDIAPPPVPAPRVLMALYKQFEWTGRGSIPGPPGNYAENKEMVIRGIQCKVGTFEVYCKRWMTNTIKETEQERGKIAK